MYINFIDTANYYKNIFNSFKEYIIVPFLRQLLKSILKHFVKAISLNLVSLQTRDGLYWNYFY